MKTEYNIRLARPEDIRLLPAIESAAAELYKAQISEPVLNPLVFKSVTHIHELEDARRAGSLWVAADLNDLPVGFALVRMIDGEAYLAEMDVQPSHGRRGLGSALLVKVCDWAHETGIRAVMLSTFRDVPWNGPFYARHGFRVLERGELSPGFQDILKMERNKGLRTDLRVVMRYETKSV
jgi:GNAT superfamily N-acetyltransferase